jgi:hypothetical protein
VSQSFENRIVFMGSSEALGTQLVSFCFYRPASRLAVADVFSRSTLPHDSA